MFNLECNCGHHDEVSAIDGHRLEIQNVHKFFSSLSCTSCNQQNFRLFKDDTLLIDCENLISCNVCSNPIILPRVQALPDVMVCVSCKTDQENGIESNVAHVPEKFNQCPKGHKSVIRTNSYTGERFIGCSMFPMCRWSADL